MKDKKLFGKFNIIDLLVVLLILAAGVFAVYRVIPQRPSQSSAGISRIEYVVKVLRVDPAVYENAKKWFDQGETQLIAGDSFINGNVVDMYAEPYETTVANSDGEMVLTQDPYYLTVYCTMQGPITDEVVMKVVSQETRVGLNNVVKTRGFCFTSGTVISVEVID